MSLPPGTRLGPYEIVSLLGAGGMGEVYRAHDPKLDRAVAIKILPAAFAMNRDRSARLRREAHILFRDESGESIRPDTFVLRSGRAMLYPIFKGTFERYEGPTPRQPVAIRDALIAWRSELSRSIDYLRTRADIDASKRAYVGHSLGAEVAPILLATERRFATAVLLGGGLTPLLGPLPEANVINFLPRVKTPVLMVNGAYDSILPVTQAQRPMFDRLGTSVDHKRHVIVPSGHSVTVPEVRLVVIKEVLDWFERYLGGS